MKQKRTIAQRLAPKTNIPKSVQKAVRERAQIEFDQYIADGQAKLGVLPTNQLKLF